MSASVTEGRVIVAVGGAGVGVVGARRGVVLISSGCCRCNSVGGCAADGASCSLASTIDAYLIRFHEILELVDVGTTTDK